ncbi:MAG: hypothetical protein ACRD0B_07505, partial [Acidimicrobiales bacterium]
MVIAIVLPGVARGAAPGHPNGPAGAAHGQATAAHGQATAAHGQATAAHEATGPHSVSSRYAYYLATANGGVYNIGGSKWYGSARAAKPSAPIVAIATSPDERGYWLAGSEGAVYRYGDAKFYGSLTGKISSPAKDVVSLAATADGRGYWLIDASGDVFSFGDAGRIGVGALPGADLQTPIVAATVTPDGHGAWLVNSAGDVFSLGDATWFGSIEGRQLASPITTIVSTPDGSGYWLASAAGNAYAFGDAAHTKGPSAPISGSIVGIIPAEDEWGYWAASSSGYVLAGGDATSRGGVTEAETGAPVVGIAPALGPLPIVVAQPYPSGSIGYDINWPQCARSGSSQAGTLPGPPKDAAGTTKYSVAIVGVDGWAIDDPNSCLAAEASWAARATEPAGVSGTPAYELYMFINSPGSGSTIDKSGPGGTCSRLSG